MPTNFAYTKRFNAVLAYIDANLEGDLSVKTLSHVRTFRRFTSIGNSPRS
jgi:AraC family transcriptional regulator